MHLKLLIFFSVTCALFCETDAWFWRRGNSSQCPKKGGASPYYFGTTNLWCIKKGKREAPSRGTWSLSHRFIYYKGYYFEFLRNSNAVIGTSARDSHRCSSRREGSPAGYSRLSLECIKGCARNYRCTYGRYRLLGNNCHKFANRLSAVLCTTGTTCPSWCLGSCNHAEEG
uniref:Uncharacterized protein LOC111137850 n=1 Tax=Crassostrea virginica TaxID=6565 RepID=A0A8B8EZ92_CRAVI|nr:uncharacterized protein LOC111137850 [Crassostrea virginica]